jgi:hypothetical protein
MVTEPNLEKLFADFCEHFNNKLLWKRKGKPLTKAILDFFSAEAGKLGYRIEKEEYMRLDQVWWSETSDIELALEHELQERRAGKLIQKEVRHLIDIKAHRKVLIAYLSEPDERTLVANVQNWIGTHRFKITYPAEEYMIVIGRPTTKEGKRVFLYRRYLFYYTGAPNGQPKDYIITQAKSPLDPTLNPPEP